MDRSALVATEPAEHELLLCHFEKLLEQPWGAGRVEVIREQPTNHGSNGKQFNVSL